MNTGHNEILIGQCRRAGVDRILATTDDCQPKTKPLKNTIFNSKLRQVKKLPLIITLTLAGGLVALYFFYTQYYNRSTIKAWDIVPSEAILVYEPGSCSACLSQASSSPAWQIVSRASLHTKPADSLKAIRDLLDIGQSAFSLISLHITKKDDFDFVFYSTAKAARVSQLDSLLTKLKRNKQVKFSEREFNATRIREIAYNKYVFSWTVIDDIWIGSFTPFLVEDVIRTHEAGPTESFKEKLGMASRQVATVKSETGSIFVHLPNFSKWLSVFTDGELPFMMKNLGQSIALDTKLEEKSLALNGFSSDSANRSGYALSIFSKQAPVPLSLKQLISNRTAMLVSYGISDGSKIRGDIQSFPDKFRKSLNDTLAVIGKELATSIDPLYQSLKGELGISYLESREKKLSKILMVQTADAGEWLKTLNALSEKVSVDTVFLERFSEYEIRELPIHNFPEKIFWPLASGFKTTFYTSLGNTVLIAEDIEELKSFLDDMDREETWGKSVIQNQFLETTLLEASLSVYINTPKMWNILSTRLRPEWATFVQENRSLLNALKMGAIQFSHLDENYYTNVAWAYGTYKRKERQVAAAPALRDKVITNFSHALHKSFVVESHVNQHDEIITQDSAFQVHLLSSEGKVLWKLPVDEPIMGTVHQVDYYKNGKLQYLFVTGSMLHLVDRLGKYVEHFPVSLKTRDADGVSVIDYDHSKKYRFLVTGRSGKLWMFDKEGNALEGWRPNDVEGNLLIAPRHHRIRGKDYIIAIRADGAVYLMNRRGELYNKFPLRLDARLSGDYFLEIGASAANTYFIVVARDGFKIKFNLEGKVLNRETLIKTAIDAQFKLVCDANRRSYIVARQENKQLTLIDEENKEILKNEYVGHHPINIEYYDFRSGNLYYTITDLQESLSFVYDAKGNLLTSPPLESRWIEIRQDGDNLRAFGTVNKALTIQQIP